MIRISSGISLFKYSTFELKMRHNKYMAWIIMIIFEPTNVVINLIHYQLIVINSIYIKKCIKNCYNTIIRFYFFRVM